VSAPVLERRVSDRAGLAERPLGPTRGWRLPLVMAVRDLRRHPFRTAAAAVMVLVPVMAASALAVVLTTSDVSAGERVLAQMGSADAVVVPDEFTAPPEEPYTSARVADRVGVPVVEVRRASASLRVGDVSTVRASVLATDWANPVTDGILQLREGRLPTTVGEVALSPGAAADLGAGVGDQVSVVLDATGGPATATVTGLAYELWSGPADPSAVLTSDALPVGAAEEHGSWWLLPDADGAAVDLGDPYLLPHLRIVGRGTVGRYEDGFRTRGLGDSVILVAVGLALVVLEIALLAGPAFAVGVRQQQQTLALLAATGGDGRALRRVVLAQAAVVGAGAAVAGATLGTAFATLAVALARARTDVLLGPLDLRWNLLAGFVAVGVVSAFASALVPAVTAARATVVGALTPRTSSQRVPWRRPTLGLLLLVAGTWLLIVAALDLAGDSAILGAVAVLVMGVGMVLVVPLPVALLGRATTRLPLGMRLAGRESTRAATRSVAAVAAVAGASAALIAGLTSTAALRSQDAAGYVATSAYGVTSFGASSWSGDGQDDVAMLVERLRAAAPDAQVAVLTDASYEAAADTVVNRSFWLPSPGCEEPPAAPAPDTIDWCWTAWTGQAGGGGTVLVVDPLAAALLGYDLDPDQQAVLDDGGVLVPRGSTVDLRAGAVPLAVASTSFRGPPSDPGTEEGSVRLTSVAEVPATTWSPPAWSGPQRSNGGPPALLLSPAAAAGFGIVTPSRVLLLPAGVDEGSTVAEVRAATAPILSALPAPATRWAYTEVGYVDPWRVVDVLVVVAAAVVVLGATFTATALALADARRDRTVLTAVGASPATQRAVAGSTAALVAGTGALVGTAVGLLVGLVVAWSVLRPGVVSTALGLPPGSTDAPDPLLGVVPWGWVAGFVLGLPLLAGLVVALLARGRPDAEAARLSARVG
jgi:putative ABC transport system permease protein